LIVALWLRSMITIRCIVSSSSESKAAVPDDRLIRFIEHTHTKQQQTTPSNECYFVKIITSCDGLSLRCDLVVSGFNSCTLLLIHRKFMPLSVVLNVLSPRTSEYRERLYRKSKYKYAAKWTSGKIY
jgi:hypothetical protein